MAAATTTPAVASSSPVNVKLLLIGNASTSRGYSTTRELRLSEWILRRVLFVGFCVVGRDTGDCLESGTVSYVESSPPLVTGDCEIHTYDGMEVNGRRVKLMYLVASRETFDALPKWFAEIDTYGCPIDSAEDYILNKEHSRQVPTSEGQTVVTRKECLFLESSAKASVGMREVFQDLVKGTLETPELWAPVTPESGRRKRGGGMGRMGCRG
ncbi:ras-domain-containing protein [Pisolithus thermaeus]|nr:ras-domain-containing protein [Pisolithus thermaeus]